MPLLWKRLAAVMPISLALAAVLLFTTGCGGRKAVKTADAPAPAITTPAPVSSPEQTEPETPEPALPKTAVPALEKVYFDFDRYDITPMMREVLATNAQALRQRSNFEVVIEGHCDERGTIEYNLALGDRRARAVKDYLVLLGVDGSRLSTVSYGKERPVNPDHNEQAWAQNRRAEFVVRTQPRFSDSNQ